MFTKTTEQPKNLDIQEAYNLWDILNTRYINISKIMIYQNFIHDQDFSLLLKKILIKSCQKEIKELEALLEKYNINLPRRPAETIRSPGNSEIFEDSIIAKLILKQIQENISMLVRQIKTTITTDNLRNIFEKFLFQELSIYHQALKYFKAKGWFDSAPIYPRIPLDSRETLDSGEAYNLWHHLTARYDAVEMTQIFETFAHDGDLKILLQIALRNTLEKQVKILEKEMNYFALPLPQRPPKSVKNLKNTEIIDDVIIFRRVFTGMHYFFDLHSSALMQNNTNDRLRKMYIQFLKEEITLYNKFISYGKIKGWIRHAPMYQINKN